jgi:hypothetical protein
MTDKKVVVRSPFALALVLLIVPTFLLMSAGVAPAAKERRPEHPAASAAPATPTPTGTPRGPITIFWDDFEGANTWTGTGPWHRVVNGTQCPPMYDSPVTCWYYGDESIGCTYQGPVQGILVSPPIGGITADSVLRFRYRMQLRTVFEQHEVSISTDPSGSPRTVLGTLSLNSGSFTTSPDFSLGAFAGRTIYIVFGANTPLPFTGTFGWMVDDVEIARPYDCRNAIPIACNDPALTYATGSANDAVFYSCSPNWHNGNESLFIFTVPPQMQVRADLTNVGPGRTLDLFLLSGCDPMSCISGGAPTLTYPYLPGGTYYMLVDGAGPGDNGSFDLELTCGPPETIACGDSNVRGRTEGASSYDTYSVSPKNYTGPEYAYLLDLPQASTLYVTLTPPPGQDLDVFLFDANNFSPSSALAYGDDDLAMINAAAGRYLLIVDGANGAQGDFTLSVDCGSRADCSNQPSITCGETINGNTNAGSSRLSRYSCSTGLFSGPELIYTFQNPLTQTVSFDFTSPVTDLSFFVLKNCDEARCILTSKDRARCVRFEKGTYAIVVDGENGASGPFSLTMSCSASRPTVDLVPGGIDLGSVQTDCRTLQISGDLGVEVANLGGTPSTGPFDIVAFEDANANGLWDGPAVDNLLGTLRVTGAVLPGQTQTVRVPLSGSVLFNGNRIYVFADSGNSIAESNESNNVADSGQSCQYQPPPGTVAPRLEWEWRASGVMSRYVHVDSTPLVINLTDDNGDGLVNEMDIPDVVFVAGNAPEGFSNGVLRALHGENGTEIFTVTDSNYRLYSSDNIAAGDLDGDGLPEIVGRIGTQQGNSRNRLLCFEHDGTFKWMSDPLSFTNADGGAPSLADLDGDGIPEIIFGRDVFNANGTLRWSGTAGNGINPIGGGVGTNAGPISTVADIDGDGRPEVVAGNTVYRNDGSILFRAPVPDGLTGIADFDDDGYPEIALVSDSDLYLVDHDGSVKWGPVAGFGGGGAPTIADFDWDCEPEIGVAWNSYYSVFESDGTLKWTSPTTETSSGVTGSAVFDFNGDGSEEVAYRDEEDLRVYNGRDGALLFTIPNTSHTWTEGVVIADVDRDNDAELIVPSNASFNGTGAWWGIQVYGDPSWIATRGIWNQHAYHITNVNDDGTIPAHETDNWEVFNNYRTQVGEGSFNVPDLAPSLLPLSCEDGGAQLRVVVGNGGGASAPPGVPVTFYDLDTGGVPVTTIQTGTELEPGWLEPLATGWTIAGGHYHILVRVDDSGAGTGTLTECREDNNECELEFDIAFPAADAGPDRTVCENEPTVLDGSASLPEACTGRLEFQWSQGPVILQAWSTVPTLTVAPAAETTYTLEVRCSTSDPPCLSNDDVTITTKDCPVAVTWDYFQVEHNTSGNVIRWGTLSEIDTLGFTVVRSVSGVEGVDNEIVAQVPSLGPGREYRLEDRSAAALAPGNLYYRIEELTAGGAGDKTPFFTWSRSAKEPSQGPVRRRESPSLRKGSASRQRAIGR